MRRFLLLTLMAVMTAGTAFAGISFTIGGGLNLSDNIFTSDYKKAAPDHQGMKIGFNGGAHAVFDIREKVEFITGLNYETRGMTAESEFNGITTSHAWTMGYLQIPALFAYKIIPQLAIHAGPELGVYLHGHYTIEYENAPGGVDNIEQGLKNVEPLDFGLSFGARAVLADRIVLGGGYYLGLVNTDTSDFNKDADGGVKHANIKFTVAYLLKWR